MPLIVGDGTLPAGANSFASVADADAYHAARLTAAWTDELAEAQKEAALIRASDWLNRKVMWNGRKASRSQRMAWPRAGVSTQDGPVPSDPAETVFPSLSGLLAGLGTVNTGKGGGIMEVGRG